MKKLINLFIPNSKNNYHPYLIRKSSLAIYLLLIIIFNLGFSIWGTNTVQAQVSSSVLYELHNQERLKSGLTQLSINSDLVESATKKAEVMLELDCWSHYCPSDTTPWVYFDQSGYKYIFAGENLAEGFDNNENVISAWLNSPTHRDNMLKPEFSEIGIGFAYGDFQGKRNNTIIVVHFGSRTVQPEELPVTNDNNIGNQIQITNPKNNLITNNNNFNIEGIAPDFSLVTINSNNQEIGRVNAEGGIFTYRAPQPYNDGLHQFSAQAFTNNGTFLGLSNKVNVTIDTIAPQIVQNSLKVEAISIGDSNKAIISLIIEGNPQEVKTSIANITFSKTSVNTWDAEIEVSVLQQIESFELSAIDNAQNKDTVNIFTNQLLPQIQVKNEEVSALELENNEQDLIITNFVNGDLQFQFNIFFAIFLLSLFGIDYYFLASTGLTAIKRSKSHLHFGIIILLLFVAFLGGLGGKVLTGLQI